MLICHRANYPSLLEKTFLNYETQISEIKIQRCSTWWVVGSDVRGGGWGRPPPWLEKFRANSVFRASSSCSKILKDKKYFNTVKIFRANSVFRGKRRLFKILNDEKYIFNTVNSGQTLFFRASANCSKIIDVKTIFNTVKNFREISVFRASASCSKFWMMKNTYSIQWIQGTLCFSGQAKVAQTSWM